MWYTLAMKTHTGPYHRLFAWLFAQSSERIDSQIAEYKRKLLPTLQGDVVEIGPGTGANLSYFAPRVRWVGVEPNPYMHPYLRREAERLGRQIELYEGSAEQLPVVDASADAVVGTLVLCSVDSVEAALAEVRRVLKPGGRFIFIEHVAALQGTGRRRLQNLVQPLWTPLADGCHPNRETWRAIESAGFTHVELEHFEVASPLVAPHIMGVATK
jgi:ubiquinone/menaquinone biosynthesis C-methylase UbiE